MLIRTVAVLSLFLVATAVTPSASAQTPPPAAPSRELSAPAPAPTLDATIIIEIDSGEANVQLDGQPLEGLHSVKRAPVVAGHHVVEASMTGRSRIRREIDVGAGGTVGVVLNMVPLRTDAIGYDAPQEDAPSGADRGPPRLPGLILISAGVSVVGLGLGIGFNLAANANSNSAVAEQTEIGQAEGTTSSCNTPASRFARACTALHDDLVARDQNADVAVAAYATAGLAAAATIAFAVWFRPGEGHRKWTSSLRPAPILGTSTGGFAVAGVF
jgi:hypothetical protein